MRELDAKVAEKVMGWDLILLVDSNLDMPDAYGRAPEYRHEPGLCYPIPNYTTDPAADYEVLKHVRETWAKGEMEIDLFDSFLRELGRTWMERHEKAPGYGREHELARFYEPGDYSKAALKALGENIDSP